MIKAFNILRREGNLILTLFALMASAGTMKPVYLPSITGFLKWWTLYDLNSKMSLHGF